MRNRLNSSLFKYAALSVMVIGAPSIVFAQDGEAVSAEQVISEQKTPYEVKLEELRAEIEQGVAEAKQELKDEEVLTKKLELAKRMHAVRPTRDQIDSAIEVAALKIPAVQREAFKISMREALNYNAIEKISIDAMIETFTLKELIAMVEYYEKPEAMSASKKLGAWAGQVQPEIGRMIDRAIMRARLGQ